jgi:ABC-type glycerol-3-phosphate transport system substrate-binding protein
MTKKLLVLLAFVLLMCAGCNANGSNLYKFDPSTLKGQVKDHEIQPKLPTKLPLENVEASLSSPPDQGDVLTFYFFTTGEGKNNHLELLVVKNKASHSNIKFEEVEIGDLKGHYAVNEDKAQILRWKEKDLEYSLIYYGQQSDKELSKEDLIETAKAFK